MIKKYMIQTPYHSTTDMILLKNKNSKNYTYIKCSRIQTQNEEK